MAQPLTNAAIARLAQRLERNATFAAVKATNTILNEAQQDLRAGIAARFQVRQTTFINNLVKRRRDDFATKDQPIGRLRIEGPQSETSNRTARILTRHEEGGISLPTTGADPVLGGRFALPTDVLRIAGRSERSRYSLKNLGLVPIRDPEGRTYYAQGRNSIKGKLVPIRATSKGVVQIKGKRRVFALDPRYHRGVSTLLVYMRTGPKKDDLQLLYFGAPRVTISPRLFFLKTARTTIDRRRVDAYRIALKDALR